MKDAYSFHASEASLRETYREIRAAYERILADVGLEFAVVDAENSVMGGSRSEEFVAPVADGSDRLVACTADGCRFGVTDEHADFADFEAGDACPDCGGSLAASDGIEVGHVFQLGPRYSEAMDFTVDTADGESRAVEMGSYGLGVDRLLQTLVQQHGVLGGERDGDENEGGDGEDEEGLGWPVTDWGSVAPYRAAIIPAGGREDGEVQAVAREIYEDCGREDVLLYDDLSVGERFAESDLLGVPAKVVVGNTYREQGVVDVETAAGTEQLDPDAVAEYVRRFAAGSATECGERTTENGRSATR